MSNRLYRLLPLLFILLLALIFQPRTSAAQTKKEWVIVIDPGHGGTDPGAVSGTVKEKDITLAVALKLGKQLAALENTKVVYTRDKDETVELYKRPKKANECKADLFISIHCNSVESSKPYGAETWVMGLHKSKANLEVAKTENAVILLEADYETRYEGFDPNSPEAEIIFSLYQNTHLDQSVEFASLIQKEMRTVAQRFDRGVKQAGFLVLFKTNMPGILVEAGFISNENERKYLTSDAGQKAIATSIFNAVINYREKVDGVKPKIRTDIPAEEKTTDVKTSGPETVEAKTVDNKTTENIVQNSANQPKPSGQPQETVAAHTPSAPADTKPKNNPPEQIATPQTHTQSPTPTPSEVYFAVQFLSASKQKNLDDPAFAGIKDVHMYQQDGTFRYVAGHFPTISQAAAYRDELIRGVFKDAFVVAFHKGKRITTADAMLLLEK
ncbi:MAG: N-acetylmuramoyl-L-alanine amidase [Bacteroidales bacterium]